jgi:hypothetical protein
MTQTKHTRMQKEYDGQCQRLREKQVAFRKIGRSQIERRALQRKASATTAVAPTENKDEIIKRGIKTLQMTPELCGLLRRINNTCRMLHMPEVTPRALLR